MNSTTVYLSTKDLSRRTRVTLRQLQHWDESKIFSPVHRGHSRNWTLEDCIGVALVAGARRKGLSLQKIQPWVRKMQRDIHRFSGAERFYLMTDGIEYALRLDCDSVVEHFKAASRPTVLVEVVAEELFA